jgi:hypothetical protein
MAQNESDDRCAEDDDAATAAAAASSSRRPSRRAAAEAMHKLHAQSATGKRRRGRSLSEERKEAYVDTDDAGEDEDCGAARMAARSIRRSTRHRGASAAAAAASSSSVSGHSKLRARKIRRSNGRDERQRDSSEDESSSSAGESSEESGSNGAVSELSGADEDGEDDTQSSEEFALLDALDDQADVDDADEWRPGADASSTAAFYSRRRPRTVHSRPPLSLLKIRPIDAVQRFFVDSLEELGTEFSYRTVEYLVETMDERKSVTPQQSVVQPSFVAPLHSHYPVSILPCCFLLRACAPSPASLVCSSFSRRTADQLSYSCW